MNTNFSRRNLLAKLGFVFAYTKLSTQFVLAQSTEELKPLVQIASNFHKVYENITLKNEFLLFLTNVFHLYPEQKLHALIESTVAKLATDKDIYLAIQPKLATIGALLKDLTYSFPALTKQKQVMSSQTLELLNGKKDFASYLEVGSTGRYLDYLEENIAIGDERYFIAERKPTFSPADMVDRGQINKAGKFISLANYRPIISKEIAPTSVDLVCVYIGLHHCPVQLRNEFISSLRALMKPNSKLILRDHNVNSVDMWHMVALAHDVFNMGTMETVSYNETELRNFYSLDTLVNIMKTNGFKTDGRRLLQTGDPTHNALMVFTLS
jgi:hypothetical protein